MLHQTIVIGAIAIGAIAILAHLLWSKEAKKAKEDEINRYPAKNSNNHDNCKVKHRTRQDAETEADRMRRRGYEGSERLNTYYNPDLQGWYVGKGKFWEIECLITTILILRVG